MLVIDRSHHNHSFPREKSSSKVNKKTKLHESARVTSVRIFLYIDPSEIHAPTLVWLIECVFFSSKRAATMATRETAQSRLVNEIELQSSKREWLAS